MSEILRNMTTDEEFKEMMQMLSEKEYDAIMRRNRKIDKYNLVQWNGGEGIWGTIAEMRKHEELRLKQWVQDKILWKSKGKVRPRLRDIKIRWVTPLTKRAIMAMRLAFTVEEKLKIFERANWKCEWCGNEYALHADHIKPKSRYPELAHDWENNGRCLCAKCHAKRHEEEKTRGWERLKKMAERQMKTATVPTKDMAMWRHLRRMYKEMTD